MEAVILIHMGLAIWLLRYFQHRDRGSKEPAWPLRIAVMFGVAAGFAAGYLNDIFVPDVVLARLDNPDLPVTTPQLLQGVLTIGIIEELIKFVPLALFIYKKGYFNELTDGVVYFALAGMWFGALESIIYGLIYGADVGIMRAVVTPFLHASFTALAGIGLARNKFLTRNPLTIAYWVCGAIFVHGLYNFLLFTGGAAYALLALLLAIGINVAVFWFFRVAQRWDEARGMSAIGENRFCRRCGLPNPERSLYCIRCGNKT